MSKSHEFPTELYQPNSIAIVGASNNSAKIGHVLVKNLLDSNFIGEIFPVNPKEKEILGQQCFSTLREINQPIDIVCIAVPAEIVTQVIKDAVEAQVKIAIIITAGFRETGEAGVAIEKEIAAIASAGNLRILGPNCLGLLVPSANLNLSFAPSQALDGNTAVLAQSGAVLTTLLDKANQEKFGFSHLVSCGNKLDLNEQDFFTDWLLDSKVKVIGAYLEEVTHGRSLLNIINSADQSKPLVILKPGVTKQAEHAIHSHTGSMTGSNTVIETACAQHGIHLTHDLSTFFDLLTTFSLMPYPKGNRVAILTNAGGPGIIATDQLVMNGLQLIPLSEETQQKLKDVLPESASVHNPVDLIGDAPASRYKDTLEILLNSDEVDMILIVLTPQLVTEEEETANCIAEAVRLQKKPIATIFLGGTTISTGIDILRNNQVPRYADLDDAAKALAALHLQSTQNSSRDSASITVQPTVITTSERPVNLDSASLSSSPTILQDEQAFALANAFSLPLPAQSIVHSLEEADHFMQNHQSVVLKITSEVLQHKTDQKGVYLNISTKAELTSAWNALSEISQAVAPNSGLLIQEFVSADVQVFLGVNRDGSSKVYQDNEPGFGHIIAVGKGGIYTEVYEDLAFCLTSFGPETALKTLRKTKISQIIEGVRGQEPLAIDAVLDVMMNLQRLVMTFPEIVSLDLNPLLVKQDSVCAVDLKMYLQA